MDLIALATPILLSILAILVIGAFVKVTWSAVRGILAEFCDEYDLRRGERQVKDAEALPGGQFGPRYLEIIRTAIVIYPIGIKAKSLQRAHAHNLGILGKVISLAERQNSRLEMLPIVEDLLRLRVELISRHQELKRTRVLATRRQEKKGAEVPQWAKIEFGSALKELEQQILLNRKTLLGAIEDLFRSLREPPREEVTFH